MNFTCINIKTRLIYYVQILRQLKLNYFMIPDDARTITLIYLEQWKGGGGMEFLIIQRWKIGNINNDCLRHCNTVKLTFQNLIYNNIAILLWSWCVTNWPEQKHIRQASWLKITKKGNTGLEINATHCTNVSTKRLYNLFVFLIVAPSALIGIFSCITDWF